MMSKELAGKGIPRIGEVSNKGGSLRGGLGTDRERPRSLKPPTRWPDRKPEKDNRKNQGRPLRPIGKREKHGKTEEEKPMVEPFKTFGP